MTDVACRRAGARAARRCSSCWRVHHRAARGRPAGEPDREPRRHGGGQAHPARGPGGVQVRAGRHAGEEQRPLAEPSRPSSRSTSRCVGSEYAHRRRRRRRRCSTTCSTPWSRCRARARVGAGRRRWRALTPEELAELLYQALMDGDDAMMRAIARQAVQPLRRHGAGPARRRHLLPVPHAAEPRPRRRAREADGAARQRRRRAD